MAGLTPEDIDQLWRLLDDYRYVQQVCTAIDKMGPNDKVRLLIPRKGDTQVDFAINKTAATGLATLWENTLATQLTALGVTLP